MNESKNKVKVVVAAVLALCVLAVYFGRGSHSEWVDFGFRLFNFAIFTAIIWYAAGDKIKNFFKKRSQDIAKELIDLENAKVQAAKHLKEVEAQIINLDKERQAILASYKAQGEALKSEIIVKAEKTAKQIVAQAKLTARSEVDKAMEQIRAEMAEEIITATEKILRERLNASEHEKLINKSLTKVVLN